MLLGLVLDLVRINTITPVSYENNSGLCGGPLNFCNQHKYCVFEVSFRNGFVVNFAIFAFPLFDFWENAGKWSWIFQLWVYNLVDFPRKQSKRKWKGKKNIWKDT